MSSDIKTFSHDLKNTLTTITVNAQLLKRKLEKKNGESMTGYTDAIIKGVERAVKQLHEFRERNGKNG